MPRRKHHQAVILSLFMPLLLSCDSENEKAWSEWRRAQEKIAYRCGKFGSYEIKVDKKYLFFWPTYEGRSDWDKDKGPPPTNCDSKLSALSVEAYWPGLSPAGYRPIETDPKVEHISITINSVVKRERWDLARHLELHGIKKNSAASFRADIGLFHFRGIDSLFRNLDSDYYWVEERDGIVSTFIKCGPIKNGKSELCEQTQYLPKIQAILIVRYNSSKLESWKELSQGVVGFIYGNLTFKGN